MVRGRKSDEKESGEDRFGKGGFVAGGLVAVHNVGLGGFVDGRNVGGGGNLGGFLVASGNRCVSLLAERLETGLGDLVTGGAALGAAGVFLGGLQVGHVNVVKK